MPSPLAFIILLSYDVNDVIGVFLDGSYYFKTSPSISQTHNLQSSDPDIKNFESLVKCKQLI